MTKKFKEIIESIKEENDRKDEEERKEMKRLLEEEAREEGMTPLEEETIDSNSFISFPEKQNDFSKEKIKRGYSRLNEIIRKSEKIEKKLDDILQRNDSLFEKFFEIVKATEKEKEDCLEYISRERTIIDDFKEMFFSNDEEFQRFMNDEENPSFDEHFKGIPTFEYLNATFTKEEKEKYIKAFKEKPISKGELKERIENSTNKEELQEKIFFPTFKEFNFTDEDGRKLIKLLDEQLTLSNETSQGIIETGRLNLDCVNLCDEFMIFEYNPKKQTVTRNENANQEGIELYFKIIEEAKKIIENNQRFVILSKRKGIQEILPEIMKYQEEEIRQLQINLKQKQQLQRIKIDGNRSLVLDSQVRFNDKISNNLTLLEKGKEATFTNIFGKEGKFKDEQINASTSESIDDFEREVLFLCYSVLKKNPSFTIRQIREKMTGRENRNPTELDDEIEKSIEKLRKTDFRISLSDKIIKEKYQDFKEQFSSGLEDYILPLGIEEKTNSVNQKGIIKEKYYYLKGQSSFFIYAERTGMIQTFGEKLIKCEGKNKVNFNSKERIVARQILLSKIKTLQSLLFKKEELQKQKKWSKKQEQQFQNLQNIYLKDFKLPEPYDKAKRRNVDFIEGMLSNYQEQKEIKSFHYIIEEEKFNIIPLITNYKENKMINHTEEGSDNL